MAIGEGHRAALVVEGAGASAELVSLWGLHDYDDEPCSLGRLTVGDDTAPLRYPVGDDENDWTSEQLTWSGAGALNIAGTDGGTVATADAAGYTGLNCPGISVD